MITSGVVTCASTASRMANADPCRRARRTTRVRAKAASADGVDQISGLEGDNVTVIEGIDVTQDDVGSKLQAALAGVTIDVLVHNAGSINATREIEGGAMFGEQALQAVTAERMLATFNLNTVGPIRVQQALTAQMASPGGKVVIISTGMGSIKDNGSGGLYAYRASKAAVRRGNEAYIGRRRAELAAALRDVARGGYLLVDKAVGV